MILIGMDGGGTKTACMAADLRGNVLARAEMGGCNYYAVGMEGIRTLLKEATQALLAQAGSAHDAAVYAVVGMPVVEENREVERQVTEHLAGLFRGFRLCNDAVVGLAGSLGGEHGINVICGTGSICSGYDGQKYVRCGGWSGQFCDEGSCHWLGRRALELFTKQADGRLPRSALTDIFRKRLGLVRDLDITYIINHELNHSRKQMAALQRMVAEAALAGDDQAMALYRQAAEEISLMVHTVRRNLNLPAEVSVSYAGGLFRVAFVQGIVEKALGEGYRLRSPRFSPAQGALILAAQACLPSEEMPGFLARLEEEQVG